jgi:hypothetical protein
LSLRGGDAIPPAAGIVAEHLRAPAAIAVVAVRRDRRSDGLSRRRDADPGPPTRGSRRQREGTPRPPRRPCPGGAPRNLIKELPLRDTVATAGVGEAFAVPKDTDPLAELARELSILSRREQANRILERLAARAKVDLEPAEIWLLGRLNRDPDLDVRALADAYAIDPLRLDNAKRALVDAGLIEGGGTMTAKGKQTLDTLVGSGRDRLDELSDGWQPEQHPELRELIDGLARQFIDTPVAPGTPHASTPHPS